MLPRTPERTVCRASWYCGALRCHWPTCTRRFERRAAATIARASAIELASGFSQYTCFPAASASVRIRQCQWSGVPTITASTSLSSSSFR